MQIKIKNLTNSPLLLGDGKLIGASNTTSDTRPYGLDRLTERDQQRLDDGKLEVVRDEPVTETQTQKNEPIIKIDDDKSKSIGGKGNAK